MAATGKKVALALALEEKTRQLEALMAKKKKKETTQISGAATHPLPAHVSSAISSAHSEHKIKDGGGAVVNELGYY